MHKCFLVHFAKVFRGVVTGRKLNVHKTFIRYHERGLLNVLSTFNLIPVKKTYKQLVHDAHITEAVTRRSSVKEVFLKISQNSRRKTPVLKTFYNKVAG